MNEDHRDIDRLLKANVERQLAGFDWDRFAGRLGQRLAADDLQGRSRLSAGRLLVAAAAIILVGVVAVVVVRPLEGPIGKTMPGRATVVIGSPARDGAVRRCDVHIHSPAEPKPDDTTRRPSWCIVAGRELPQVDSDDERNLASLACLF